MKPYALIFSAALAAPTMAQDEVAVKIRQGGGGNWGNVPMVPNQRVSAEEARRMAAWILDLSTAN